VSEYSHTDRRDVGRSWERWTEEHT